MRKNKKQQEEPRNNQIIENDVFKRIKNRKCKIKK